MLIAGCYVIGRREKGKDDVDARGEGTREGALRGEGAHLIEEVDGGAVDLDKLDEPDAPLPRARSRSPYKDRDGQDELREEIGR